MSTTKRIPRDEWQGYLDRFTKAFLRDDRYESVSIEHLSPELGDQVIVRDERLLGITWDSKDGALDIALGGINHIVGNPQEIFVLEDDDSFVSAIEIVRDDGVREIVQLHRAAPLTQPHDPP